MQSNQFQITTELLFDAIQRLPENERLKLFDRFNQPKQKQKQNGHRRKAQTEIESDLLARIQFYSHLPQKSQRRLNHLRRKRQAETITDSELTELQALWSRVEWMNVERLEALIELAKLRKTDLKTLMHDLGLDKKRNVF